jgi:FGGY family of carbohydrate kinases, C-terminal domain
VYVTGADHPGRPRGELGVSGPLADAGHDPAEGFGALLEGIAAQVAGLTGLIAADLGGPLTRLRVDGGLTRSRVLMQAQADLAQIPVDVYPSAHATPFGAVACARLALDPAADLANIVGGWKPEHTYEPAWPVTRLARAEVTDVYPRTGRDFHTGRRAARLLREAGLQDVQVRVLARLTAPGSTSTRSC